LRNGRVAQPLLFSQPEKWIFEETRMTDAEKKSVTSSQKAEPAAPAAKQKSPLMKYLIFGVVIIVLVAVGATVTLMMIGDPPVASGTPPTSSAASANTQHGISEDSLAKLGLNDSSLDRIVSNLEALSYDPESLGTDPMSGLSTEDSLTAAGWIKKEKQAIASRKSQLDTREQELNRRETEVAKKLLILEQAKSEQIAQLVKLYDGMEPEAVARLMGGLDDRTVVAVLPRMKTKNASAVLQAMPPMRAAKLSNEMITIAGDD
jgi:hypothetical protein